MDPVSVEINLLRAADVPEAIREKLHSETVVRADGQIWIRIGDRFASCEDTEAGEEMVKALSAGEKAGRPQRDDPWRTILQGGRARDLRIRDGKRCVILFGTDDGQENQLTPETFAILAPTERGDAVTVTQDGYIALIKNAEDHSEEDISEYTAAVIGTIETEAGIRAWAGIGSITGETAGLAESRAKAAEAIRIGKQFRPEEYVYAFDRMQTERMISAIPEDIRKELRRELNGDGKQLTAELMETARAFLQNDMNLTTTAKQLYIHRNTLIYRLDKIRKETGFDLRRFRDAAAFQMISQIPGDDQ